jgi:hypothetical protein
LKAVVDAPRANTAENGELVRVLVERYKQACRDHQAFIAFKNSSSYA